jgi:transcription elongation GreA/GreB family factor
VTAAQTFTPRGEEPFGGEHPRESGVFLRSSDFEALIGELESLRAEVDARRVRERVSLIELASELTRVATVAGGAGPGSVVKVADRAGRVTEYELILGDDADRGRQRVTLSSPVGNALLGARPGVCVQVTPSNGRRHRVRVIDVTPAPAAPLAAPFDGGDPNT